MNMLGLYDAILKFSGLVADEEGFVSSVLVPDNPMPANIKIDGKMKRLVIPTSANLKKGSDGQVVFHPLRENLMHGESKVIEYLRTAINYRINITAAALVTGILELALDTDVHPKLSTKQIKLMSLVKEVDEKTLKFWEHIVTEIPITDTKEHISSVYLRKLGKVDGKQFFTVAVWAFPLYKKICDSITKQDTTFYKRKCRKKDLTILKEILEYLLPMVKDGYSFGSNNKQAPFLHALMESSIEVARHLNEATDVLFGAKSGSGSKSDRESAHKRLTFETEFGEMFDNLGAIESEIKLTPPQPGNDAPSKREEGFQNVELTPTKATKVSKPKVEEEVKPLVSSAPIQRETITAESVTPVQESKSMSNEKSVTMDQIINGLRPQPQVQYVQPAQPVQPVQQQVQYVTPQGQVVQPQYVQQPFQQPVANPVPAPAFAPRGTLAQQQAQQQMMAMQQMQYSPNGNGFANVFNQNPLQPQQVFNQPVQQPVYQTQPMSQPMMQQGYVQPVQPMQPQVVGQRGFGSSVGLGTPVYATNGYNY